MRAGKLDRLLVIERSVTTFDDARTQIETWTPVATLRAQLLRSSEVETQREPGASTDSVLTFRARFHPAVSPKDRVTYQGDHLDIVEVSEIGRRAGLEIRCVTRRT